MSVVHETPWNICPESSIHLFWTGIPWCCQPLFFIFKRANNAKFITDSTVQAVCTSMKNLFIHGVMQNCRHDKRPSRNPWIQIFYDAWCKGRILQRKHFIHFRMYPFLEYIHTHFCQDMGLKDYPFNWPHSDQYDAGLNNKQQFLFKKILNFFINGYCANIKLAQTYFFKDWPESHLRL